MATTQLLLTSAGAETFWPVLLVVYCGLAAMVIVAVIWVCRTDEPYEPIPVRQPHEHLTLRPLLLTEDDAGVVLDGLLEDDDDRLGLPVSLELVPPGNEWLAATVHDVIQRWADEDDELDLDLSRLHRPHPTVALSDGSTLVRLDVVRISPEVRSGR